MSLCRGARRTREIYGQDKGRQILIERKETHFSIPLEKSRFLDAEFRVAT
jgi:hypothetical protein